MIKEISPRSLGEEEEIEISNESGKRRSEEVVAFEVEGQRIPLLGNIALAKLGIVLYPKEGKYKLE